MKQKIPEEQIYENFSVNAARPLLAAKDKERTDGLNYVTACLKRGEKITRGDLQSTVESWSTPTTHDDTDLKKVGVLQLSEEQKPETKPPLPVETPSIQSLGQAMKGTSSEPFSTKHCVTIGCKEYRKNDDGIGQKCCQVTGYIPGNMPKCALDMDEGMFVRYNKHPTKLEPAAVPPAAPVAAGLKEKYNGNVSEVKAPSAEVMPARKPACMTLEYEICPDLRHHIKKEEATRGRVCDAINIPINQLPYNECPLDREVRLKGTLPEKFKPASEDGFGNKFIKPAPYVIKKALLTEGERDTATDALIDRTRFTRKDVEQIDELVKVNREGWACRFDLLEAAVMMLLAKAEGV